MKDRYWVIVLLLGIIILFLISKDIESNQGFEEGKYQTNELSYTNIENKSWRNKLVISNLTDIGYDFDIHGATPSGATCDLEGTASIKTNTTAIFNYTHNELKEVTGADSCIYTFTIEDGIIDVSVNDSNCERMACGFRNTMLLKYNKVDSNLDSNNYHPNILKSVELYLGSRAGYFAWEERISEVHSFNNGKYSRDELEENKIFRQKFNNSFLTSEELTILANNSFVDDDGYFTDVVKIGNMRDEVEPIYIKLVDFLYYGKMLGEISEIESVLNKIHPNTKKYIIEDSYTINPYKE